MAARTFSGRLRESRIPVGVARPTTSQNDSGFIVGNPQAMARIGSAGITSGLPVIRAQFR
jgi:hypothetical protein